MKNMGQANILGSHADSEAMAAILRTRSLGGVSRRVVFIIAVGWSLLQLWVASPFVTQLYIGDYSINLGLYGDHVMRPLHLACGLFLAYCWYPYGKPSSSDSVSKFDLFFGILSVVCVLYLIVFYNDNAETYGLFRWHKVLFSTMGVIVLLFAVYRTLGIPLLAIAVFFIFYTFFGEYIAGFLAHGGKTYSSSVVNLWISQNSIFGSGLGVSTNTVFLFVLFGAMLEKTGAGNYFIRLAFASLGQYRGGPAKAAVLSSALTGLISGSSIANVVTTGTFTIPLMKKIGFSAEKAGAIEVASSTNGQLTPPIMGAAAFLVMEYANVSYIEVVKHAFVPAIISYIALFYIVHLEAVKHKMHGLPKNYTTNIRRSLLSVGLSITGFIIISGIFYYAFGWMKGYLGGYTVIIAGIVLLSLYGLGIYIASRNPDLSEEMVTEVPKFQETFLSGLYFLLPIFVLIWCLSVERLSPGASVFWSIVVLMFLLLTHKDLKIAIRKKRFVMDKKFFRWEDLFFALEMGSRNMISIAVATAAAGIVVGTITFTGLGPKITNLIEFFSGDSFFLVLFLTAVLSLILGMGLPTTANYIVVATLMAPVIVTLADKHGMIVPLIGAHLFVFYFGILADDTPPVGLAAFAAAAISQGDPIRTGIQGFFYDIRTAILPFMFIYNSDLILYEIYSIGYGILIFLSAALAMIVFTAGLQGYLLMKNKFYESILLLIASFFIFRPDFVIHSLMPPLKEVQIYENEREVLSLKAGDMIKIHVVGTFLGKEEKKLFYGRIQKDNFSSLSDLLLETVGFDVTERFVDGSSQIEVSRVNFERSGKNEAIEGEKVVLVEITQDTWPKYFGIIPGILIVLMIFIFQRVRQKIIV